MLILIILGVVHLINNSNSAQVPVVISRLGDEIGSVLADAGNVVEDVGTVALQVGDTLGISPEIDPDIAEDANLTTPQLITKYKYNVEVHHVITEDGYILELHRITGGPKSPARKGKKVCILQHGLVDSSATWVLTGPNHGLGYALADRNYDVWLGNSRGNIYSCNHTKYNPFGSSKDRKHFWSFSWHEIGVYDLPAMIDYILVVTGEKKLQYIGHSQGTTAFFVMSSERPEYNSKIQLMHALAPVAFMANVISPPVRLISPFVSVLKTISAWLGVNEIAPTPEFLKLAGSQTCRDKAVTQIICENILFLTMGYSSDQLNTTLLPVILGHAPAGSSTNQLLHYGQEVNSKHFRQFDFGYVQNFIHYRRLSPPDYNLNNLRVPVAIYYAKDDWLASVKDVHRLLDLLPNLVMSYLVPHKAFNHIDFMWGIDAPKLVYEALFSVMNLTESRSENELDWENFIV